MRLFRIASFLLAIFVNQAGAQSLDIGGIELHLGQSSTDALKSLSAYQVRYSESAKIWLISQRGEAPFEMLGTFGVENGKVSIISKSYNLPSEYDSQRVYSQASFEVHRRGGNACDTHELEFNDNEIHGIETRCGSYRLIYYLPFTFNSVNTGPGISLSLSAK
jgi:hypothetical protein